MRDRVSALVSNGIVTQIKQLGHTAYNISVNLPTTGILRALGGTTAYLSYEINGNSAAWDVNVTIWPFSDASYSLTFDLEILIQIVIPASYGHQLTTTALANVENATISGTDVSADLLDFAGEVANFLTDQPTNIFQVAEGAIDSAGSGGTVDLGDLSTLLAAVPTAWSQALPYGFTQLTALIQQQELFLQFEHPQAQHQSSSTQQFRPSPTCSRCRSTLTARSTQAVRSLSPGQTSRSPRRVRFMSAGKTAPLGL